LKLGETEHTLVRELYFEGSYESSRRVGTHVRTVLQGASFGPAFQEYPHATFKNIEQWKHVLADFRERTVEVIVNSTVEDWLPYYMVRKGDSVEAFLTRCEEFYIPTVASTAYGMTQVQSIDLSRPDDQPVSASIVGSVGTVYSNTDTLVLATEAWVDPHVWTVSMLDGPGGDLWGGDDEPEPDIIGGDGVGFGGSSGNEDDTPALPIAHQPSRMATSRSALTEGPLSVLYTHLHMFDLAANPARPKYAASGTVPGEILNQFSLDMHNQHVRVATSDTRTNTTWANSQVNHVFVLQAQGANLQEIGSVRDLAPSERIYSARFVGDRGYVVTYREIDPLFVIDLANPAEPAVLGTLKIPGFSEYIHPLDANHLLTIGQDNGLALQIFDVSDPVHPALAAKHVFDGSEGWGYSEAQNNHKAFTYYASRGLLAFPFVHWRYGDGKTHSALELFDVDAVKGISHRGSVDHTALLENSGERGYCDGVYGVYVRRGLFIGDYVYSISYGGILANHIDHLADPPAASLSLASPTHSSYPGCYE